MISLLFVIDVAVADNINFVVVVVVAVVFVLVGDSLKGVNVDVAISQCILIKNIMY